MDNFDITWVLAILSLSGNIFNVKKSVVCFYIWAIGEICWLMLDIHNGVFGRAFLDFTQLIFALWGIYEWQIKRSKNKKQLKMILPKRKNSNKFKYIFCFNKRERKKYLKVALPYPKEKDLT